LAYEGLAARMEDIPVGISEKIFEAFEKTRIDIFQKRVAIMSGK
jgi:hypothetical protein